MSELKPCPVPWCTDPRPQVANITASCFVVRCNECQTKTPHFFTKAEAIEAWNTRAITSQGERIAMLEALVGELAGDLASEINHRCPIEAAGHSPYPSMRRRYDNDMETVIRARAALDPAGEDK